MEQDNKKRTREREDNKDSSSEQTAKKKLDLNHDRDHDSNVNNDHPEDNDSYVSSNNYLALGVFDFPWLHEGMISKPEDCNFEDTFSSCLNESCTTAGFEFSGQYCLCETVTELESIDFPGDKFEDNVWPLEGDGVDSIWSSLLNQGGLQ